MIRLIEGDCLEVMKQLTEEGVKVDAVIADPPYGKMKTKKTCLWDSIIPIMPMWECLEKLRKINKTPIVLFCQEPLKTDLVISNRKNWRYDWYWNKARTSCFLHGNIRPFQIIEHISVYYKHLYYPIMLKRDNVLTRKHDTSIIGVRTIPLKHNIFTKTYTHRYPVNLLTYSNAVQIGKLHPTQKPLPLMRYLVRTYTKPGDTVLDFCMGSGTTGVACKELDRIFIGIEQDPKYYDIAKDRITETDYTPDLFAEDEQETADAVQGELWDESKD